MSEGLDYNQVFQLQMREAIRAYVRELDDWDTKVAQATLISAIELVDHAKEDPDLAATLMAAEPKDLDDLINGELPEPASAPDPAADSA